MVKEAQSHAAEDQQRKALIDARNEADALAYTVEKTVTESQREAPPAERQHVESALAAVRAVLESGDLQTIRQRTDDLRRAAQALAEALQRAQSERGSRTAQTGAPSDVVDGDVIDAEPVESQK